MLWMVAGCDRQAASSSRPSTPVDTTFFYDDGTSETKSVAVGDASALDATLRPVLASAFQKSSEGRRVARWLIDDRRSGTPVPATGAKVDAELRTTVSVYRDYRVVPSMESVPAIPGIQWRRRPDDPWKDCAGAPDPETGLKRAIEYLADDLRTIREFSEAAATAQ